MSRLSSKERQSSRTSKASRASQERSGNAGEGNTSGPELVMKPAGGPKPGALKKKVIFIHPEVRRRQENAGLGRVQPIKACSEIKAVICKRNVRLFVDLELKLTDFEKMKRLLGNLSKIKTKGQLAALCACLEEQYLASAPWRAEVCGFDGPMANISDQKAKLEMAKYVFKSDAYILLPRYLRFALTRYIAAVMIETKRPYEQLKDYDKLVDRSENALPNLELLPHLPWTRIEK